jgi:tRNA1Val (adenine37-N6)-methyltransferase
MKPVAETIDSILGGAVTVVQPRHGYRFSIDSLLLGRFVRMRKGARLLELGAGCGVISLILAALWHPREVVALEIQSDLAALAQRNATLNQLATIKVIHADLRTHRVAGLTPASFDLVVANPPYRALRTGRESPNPARRLARGESNATLAQFVEAAKRYAASAGKVAFVFDASRTAELLRCLSAQALEPKRIRFVHARANAAATTILVEARKGGGIETLIEPPLVLYDRPGIYSDEARELMQNRSDHRGV